jgi:hypothetical protein
MPVQAHNLANGPGNGARNANEDESETDIERSNINGAAETTMHGGRGNQEHGGNYNPGKRLPDCERYATKGQKMERLWKLNAGLDTHRANGEDVDHSKLAKVNQNDREKRRIAETLASRLELPSGLIEDASDLAAQADGRGFTLWGGRQAVAVAAVQYVAPFDIYLGRNPNTPTTEDTVNRESEDMEIRREIRDRLGASDVAEAISRLDKATEKIGDVA